LATLALAVSEMIACVEIENGSCDPDYALLEVICHPKAIQSIYLCAEFDDCSFVRFRHLIGGLKLLEWVT